MEIKIRKATTADVPGILGIFNEAILKTTAVYDEQPRSLEKQMAWFEKKKADQMPVIVAVSGEGVLGFGTYGIFRPFEGFRFSVEHSIYVLKEFRGQGLGKILLKELVHLAKEEGYHCMIAGIDGENKGSIAFHQAFGFQEVGRLPQVGYKFNKWLDLVFLQLMLKE